LAHLTNFEKDLILETRLLPFRAVERFDFGKGAIKKYNFYNIYNNYNDYTQSKSS